MIIFNCGHLGDLSHMIVLRYKFHKNEETILLILQDDSKADIYRGLEDKKIFDKVIPYDGSIGYFQGSKERTNQVICDYFCELFERTAVDLATIDKTYIGTDLSGDWGIFAYNKRIGYSIVESWPGQLDFSRYEYMEKNSAVSRAYAELLRETSAYTGDERLTEKYILVLPRPQNKSFSTYKRTLCVDFTKELSHLPSEVKEKILSIYNVSCNDSIAIDTLILPNSAGLLRPSGLTVVEYPYLYQLILDYFVADAGNVAIKEHPGGLTDYVGRIPGVTGNLDKNFPIEFIALLHDVRIKKAVTICSTSIDKIKPYVDNTIEMGRGYYSKQLFRMLHQLYVTYSLVESVSNQSINFHHMHNFRFLQKFLRYAFPGCESKELNSIDPDSLTGDAFTVTVCCPPAKGTEIIDMRQSTGGDVITVFFNGENGFDFYNVKGQELLDQAIPIKITKTALRDDILADMSDEYIYVFAKDPEMREKVRAFSVSRALYYTGIEIKVAPLEDSEIDLIKKKICLEDIETARKEVVSCLTEW